MSTNHTTIRLEPDKKEEFSKICDSMGLTASAAINIFVTKVVQCRRIPFEISADADPFYSDENQRFLLESIAQIKRGEGKTFNDVSEILAERS
jgi:DNA-damage-inducible protein J